ncbi:hypothetical protein ANANG_G00193050 [Anguilla anguilla]|uniref:Uncharacterized protein n=1 Tax=Anguilla anguilla TaxID=7936 RepID=A0A9D3RSY4_ANGAN|nr:hypothetical protein ANANG_G00193050 [Anguilla anguilla]
MAQSSNVTFLTSPRSSVCESSTRYQPFGYTGGSSPVFRRLRTSLATCARERPSSAIYPTSSAVRSSSRGAKISLYSQPNASKDTPARMQAAARAGAPASPAFLHSSGYGKPINMSEVSRTSNTSPMARLIAITAITLTKPEHRSIPALQVE